MMESLPNLLELDDQQLVDKFPNISELPQEQSVPIVCEEKDKENRELLLLTQQQKGELEVLEESRDTLYVTNLKVEKTLLAVTNDLDEANIRNRELSRDLEEKTQAHEKICSELARERRSTAKVDEWKEKATNLQQELDRSRESEAACLTKIRTLKESYNELEEVHEHLLIEHQDLTYEREKYEALSWLRDSNEKLREHILYLESRMMNQSYDESDENDALVSILRELTEENIRLKSEVAEYCELLTETRNESAMMRAKLEDIHYGHISFDPLDSMYASLQNHDELSTKFDHSIMEHCHTDHSQLNNLELYGSSAPLMASYWGHAQENTPRPLTVPTTPEGSVIMGNTMFGELEKYVRKKRRERRKQKTEHTEGDKDSDDSLSFECQSNNDNSDTQSIPPNANLNESLTSDNTSTQTNPPDPEDECEKDLKEKSPLVAQEASLPPIMEVNSAGAEESVQELELTLPQVSVEIDNDDATPMKKSAKKKRKARKNRKKKAKESVEVDTTPTEQTEALDIEEPSNNALTIVCATISMTDTNREARQIADDALIPTIEIRPIDVSTSSENTLANIDGGHQNPTIHIEDTHKADKEVSIPASNDDHLSDGSFDSNFISELIQTQNKASNETVLTEQQSEDPNTQAQKEDCTKRSKPIKEPTLRIIKGFLTPQPKTAQLLPEQCASPRLDKNKDPGPPNLEVLLRRRKGDNYSPLLNNDRRDVNNNGKPVPGNFKGKHYIRHRVYSEASAQRPFNPHLEKGESTKNLLQPDVDIDVLPEGFATYRARLFRQQRSANAESEFEKKFEWTNPKSPLDKKPILSPLSLQFANLPTNREYHETLGQEEELKTPKFASREGSLYTKMYSPIQYVLRQFCLAFFRKTYQVGDSRSANLPYTSTDLNMLYEHSMNLVDKIRCTEMTSLNRPKRRAFDVDELSKTSNSMLDDIVKEITNMQHRFREVITNEENLEKPKCDGGQVKTIQFKHLIKLIQDLLKDMALLRMTSNDYTVAYYRLLNEKHQEAVKDAGFSSQRAPKLSSRIRHMPSQNSRAIPEPISVTQRTPVSGTLISPVSHIPGDLNLCVSQLSALVSKSSPITPTDPVTEHKIWYNRFGIHRQHGYKHTSHIWCGNTMRLDSDFQHVYYGNTYF
ncbi:hypothetical protein K493DRAFT_332392 [Basidiobolus meristosporus CBS 931.73]|uniref:Uncharacterized protein n=1 Tax=Basidiobolus meristosporus CBS 931.73 TaxID=1314790 RepID=A0A1Y1ZDC8_9FUNG|nr:hypothetical protein K493DRAFT_332392 [Basidiobolus meristosporus CBS 931.73]|eukprot:ORY08251.1 hypothetical protein K493DRAFT_332392 [Basidiobolus meristosporus CBS 931.73]